jgi:DNA ligase-1
MKRFAQLIKLLDYTTKSTAISNALVEYFSSAEDKDKVWAIALFSQKRPKRIVPTALLKEWSSDLSELPLWLFEVSYQMVGDLTETISLIVPKPTKKSDNSLSYWIDVILTLKDKEEAVKKETILDAWTSQDQDERFLFNKLITGSFKNKISQKYITDALSRISGIEQSRITHRLMSKWDPTIITYEGLVLNADPREDLSKPYPFCLANSLDIDWDQMGSPLDWSAERKWDGIRGQLILRGGEYYLWSRGEELVSDKFPELEHLKNKIETDIVIDGEILPFREGKPLNFVSLQTRIRRKNVTKKHLLDTPIIIVAFDLLEYGGEDIREKHLSERRILLQEVVKEIDSDRLLLSEEISFETWEELSNERERSRDFHSEGIILKHLHSPYKMGFNKSDWWKWQIDPMTINAVMIYAQRGQGRYAKLYKEFTFAVRDGDRLVPFTKVSSGLNEEEFKEINEWVKKNTFERFGPVRSVNPELVFELAFEGIAKSTRHKSGVKLRLPRIKQWRKDVPKSEINSLKDLNELLNEYG